MKYSIIIPTYKRPDKLIRAIKSVLNQSYQDFEIICVNDSPDFDYSVFDSFFMNLEKKNKIKYILNEKNIGVNFSRNLALSKVSSDSDYVVFLDDDDWFNENALLDVDKYLVQNNGIKWLVTNRCLVDKKLTNNIKNKNQLSYLFDYLIFKKIKGDATHVIKSDIAKKIRFSKKIKNGEEWFYFIQIPSKIDYVDFDTTMSEGYDEGGLNQSMKDVYKKNTRVLWGEVNGFKMFLYMVLRSFYDIIR